jgi:hypothetical protein
LCALLGLPAAASIAISALLFACGSMVLSSMFLSSGGAYRRHCSKETYDRSAEG